MSSSSTQPDSSSMEQIFHLLFHHPIPMWVYDLDTLAFLEVNHAALEKYGYTREQFLGMTIKDIRPQEDVARLVSFLDTDRPQLQYSGAWRHQLADGQVIDVEITSHTLEYQGRPAALVLAQDITQRQQTEAEIWRLNRVYRVLSEINQLILRVRQPKKLFAEVCRLAVEHGEFKMAWLGLLDETTQTVEVVAHAGVSEDYLAKLEISLTSAARGQGPTGQALRTGQPVVSNNIADDPRMAPWREDALRLGYRASGAFPLVVFGQAKGCLNLYAVQPHFFDDKEVQLLHELARDLSFAMEFAQRERERRAAEAQLRRQVYLLANVSEAIISTDTAFRVKTWNRAAESIYGWPAAEVIGRSLRELLLTEYLHGSLEDAAQRLFEAGEWRGEVIQTCRDGTKKQFQSVVKLLTGENGEPVGAVAVNRDVTQTKQIEQQLYRYTQRLTLATEAAGIGIWELDLREKELIWDKQMYELYGLEPGTTRNAYELWLDRVHPEDKALREADFQAAVAGEKPFNSQFRIMWPDDQVRFVEAQAMVLADDEGKPQRMVGVAWDITPRKQLEAENEKLALQFYQAQKMESIGRLAGGIAHDLNNLLVPIIGYSELVFTSLPSDSLARQDLNQVRHSAERAAKLVKQILTFSRKQVLHMEILDLNEVVQAFQKMVRRLIGEDILLQIRLGPALQPIKGDKSQLEQVLLNLAVNARDAMPTGGTLIIETANTWLDEVYTATHAEVEPGAYVMLSMSDTGHGMDPATQQRLFEPFFTTKAQGEGTGLGLATVYGIVKQHQGHIWIYSEVDQGATFKIYLPTITSPLPAPAEKSPQRDSLRGSETVLVVEDDPMVRQLVVDTLQTHGYNVLDTAYPQEALSLALTPEAAIDLLLTDVIMPRMNGRELYEQLAPHCPGLKVLFMSGYTDNVIMQHGVIKEGLTFLQKPFTLNTLLQKVRKVLAEPGGERAVE